MKFLFSIIAVVMLTESCNSSKEAASDSKKAVVENVEMKKEVATNTEPKKQDIKKTETKSNKNTFDKNLLTDKEKAVQKNYGTAIIYEAISRGFAKYVYITEDKVLLSTDRSLQKMDEYKCDANDWQTIQSLIKKLDTKAMGSLKAPTDKRLYDGAAHATLTLKQGDLAYITPTFDDGFPPEEIKELVNKVLSVGEKVKKQ
ncbi:MAG: hypothetical protein ED556_02300 [Winogradskyella sp.]|uniref:hypothetical protein n=1 Tax=Winogradskyella sp. TaxID=1883156 RepID=UPI000F3EE147|nr:hypothetical protein [Winogradskyella sp.]RNC88040.1 MAG: hypothetical protein ED556_02300 [Winogradskyella sp.]